MTENKRPALDWADLTTHAASLDFARAMNTGWTVRGAVDGRAYLIAADGSAEMIVFCDPDDPTLLTHVVVTTSSGSNDLSVADATDWLTLRARGDR